MWIGNSVWLWCWPPASDCSSVEGGGGEVNVGEGEEHLTVRWRYFVNCIANLQILLLLKIFWFQTGRESRHKRKTICCCVVNECACQSEWCDRQNSLWVRYFRWGSMRRFTRAATLIGCGKEDGETVWVWRGRVCYVGITWMCFIQSFVIAVYLSVCPCTRMIQHPYHE